MAHTVNVNIKMDEDVKKRMERACAEMGLSMSAAFTMFAKKVGREYRIPFEVSADPFYSESNVNYLRRVISDIESGKAVLKEHELIEDRYMRLLWEEQAWDDYCYWQTQDKRTLKRINALIKDIQRDRFDGIGKPEPLKEELSGWWSRRIDDVNRLVYQERDGAIIIASCRGHYDD